MRIFVVIELPEAVCDAVERLQGELGAGRLVARDNLHLTLAFLGEIDEAEAMALHDGLEAIVWHPGPRVGLAGLELFGAPERPEALALGVRPDPDLVRWHGAVMRAARRAEISLPRRRFRPHVTLARFGRNAGPAELARVGRFLSGAGDVALPDFAAQRVAMIRSTLGSGPPRHEVLALYGPEAEEPGAP
ncbi:RNA 2',3'-cyclic phosphodiesterase [Thioclava atlantica]|uniref:RNA 2',3'-cyclic phosphodiesterase n=1 Tax=Thioclava atlantica TaxID=1317124 RepID=A0A085U052_9RHOB|nr:RNA 2',3'-cyclic phosphodiesterase [Thioclava atlantica]KFE36349.1 2'-5' RNA ligase [Thioclava atlantica]